MRCVQGDCCYGRSWRDVLSCGGDERDGLPVACFEHVAVEVERGAGLDEEVSADESGRVLLHDVESY